MARIVKEKLSPIEMLDGMKEVVKNDMAVPGQYISPEVIAPERSNAICGGRQACAVGSLYLGAEIKVRNTTRWGVLHVRFLDCTEAGEDRDA